DPQSVHVVLYGPLPALDALPDEEVRVTVDLFGLITGTYSIAPDVSFPDRGIELRSIQPSQVTVEITAPLTITNELTSTLATSGVTAVPASHRADNNSRPFQPFPTKAATLPFLKFNLKRVFT
ncbi:MAG: hypothetical protein P8183_07405, partial [Anaerolineae bacterium]